MPDLVADNALKPFLGPVFEQAKVGMCLTDARGRVIASNPETSRMFQMSEEEIFGHSFLIFVPRHDRRAARECFEVVLRGGYLEQPDWHVRLRDGNYMWVCVAPSLITLPDGARGVLSVLSDVTASRSEEEGLARNLNRDLELRVQERTAELEAAFEELEGFSYSVSHDLRAPLRSINGFATMLVNEHRDTLGSDGIEHLNKIVTSTKRMARLIDDLLGFARLARVELRRQDIDLTKMAIETCHDVAPRWSHPVEFVVQPGLTAEGDPGLVRLVLTNLLENAWKFTSKAANPRVQVGFDPQKGYYVRDNGAGFMPSYASRLFKPFERLHSASEFPGSGIGLANVERVIRRHGGTIKAEGEPGKGATFYFTLGNR